MKHAMPDAANQAKEKSTEKLARSITEGSLTIEEALRLSFIDGYLAAKSESKVQEIKEPTMPFGKYQGMTIKDMVAEDLNYCEWLIQQDFVTDSLRIKIEKELEA